MTDKQQAIVIYAEDNTMQRVHTTAQLKNRGYDVRAFEDGKPALEAVRSLSEEERARAVVLTDNMMLEMNGTRLAQLLSKEFPKLPVALASTMSFGLRIPNTFGKVLDKSDGIDGMVAAMEEVLAQSRGQQPPTSPAREDTGRGR